MKRNILLLTLLGTYGKLWSLMPVSRNIIHVYFNVVGDDVEVIEWDIDVYLFVSTRDIELTTMHYDENRLCR